MKNNALLQLLKEGSVEQFNQRRAAGEEADLTGVDLHHTDLKGLEADGLQLCNAYLRQADLRGLDLRQANLEGASIKGARISGVYFPAALSAEEINLSLQHGTRMRYR
jgi:uncharacterized protein YjbI with pentapeptide repeats